MQTIIRRLAAATGICAVAVAAAVTFNVPTEPPSAKAVPPDSPSSKPGIGKAWTSGTGNGNGKKFYSECELYGTTPVFRHDKIVASGELNCERPYADRGDDSDKEPTGRYPDSYYYEHVYAHVSIEKNDDSEPTQIVNSNADDYKYHGYVPSLKPEAAVYKCRAGMIGTYRTVISGERNVQAGWMNGMEYLSDSVTGPWVDIICQ